MKTVIEHIEYLLTRNDCVVVPGWGTWVVQYDHALFDGSHSLVPPRRWLSFNASLKHNDGMLAHSLMLADGCTYDEAMARITGEVECWEAALRDHGSVVLGNIGGFEQQQDASMLFTESPHSVANVALALLPVITLQPLACSQETDDEPAQWQQPLRPRLVVRALKAVASVAAIVAVLLFISTPIDHTPAGTDYASMVAAELFAAAPADIPAPASSVASEAAPQHSSVTATVASCRETTASVAEVPADALPRYILVVGSLPSHRLAEKQIEQFRASGVTVPIHIYEHGGKARLYIEGYNTMNEAQGRLNAITSDPHSPFVGIWICKTL